MLTEAIQMILHASISLADSTDTNRSVLMSSERRGAEEERRGESDTVVGGGWRRGRENVPLDKSGHQKAGCARTLPNQGPGTSTELG